MATRNSTVRTESVGYGRLLGLQPSRAGWLAIRQRFATKPGHAVIAEVVPISELKGVARRTADAWVKELAPQPTEA